MRLEPHRPEWSERFEHERRRILAAIGVAVRTVEHIGSTAVPDLAAKPIIDILVTVEDPADRMIRSALEGAGYVLRVDEPEHRMFRTVGRDVHVHVWATDSPEVPRYLAFRDQLRFSGPDRLAYEQLKRTLAERDWDDMNHYGQAKGDLIEAILRRSGTPLNSAVRQPGSLPYLISGDRHLTGLTDPNPPVLTPRQFRDLLTETPD